MLTSVFEVFLNTHALSLTERTETDDVTLYWTQDVSMSTCDRLTCELAAILEILAIPSIKYTHFTIC